jgi:hypothetical protein
MICIFPVLAQFGRLERATARTRDLRAFCGRAALSISWITTANVSGPYTTGSDEIVEDGDELSLRERTSLSSAAECEASTMVAGMAGLSA